MSGKEEIAETKETENNDNEISLPGLTRDNVDDEFKELYDIVLEKINQAVTQGGLTPDLVRPLLLIVIEEIENFTTGKYKNVKGETKRAYAIDITKYVFEDLHKANKIDNEMYEWIMLALAFFGPTLFDGLKTVYNSIADVAEDLAENGCRGCFGRNCKRSRK